MIEGMD